MVETSDHRIPVVYPMLKALAIVVFRVTTECPRQAQPTPIRAECGTPWFVMYSVNILVHILSTTVLWCLTAIERLF